MAKQKEDVKTKDVKAVEKNNGEKNADKKKSFSLTLLFNVLQTLFFIVYTAYGFTKSLGDSKFMPFIILLIAVYVVLFVVMIILASKDSNADVKQTSGEFKQRNKDFKLAVKVINVISLLINCAASFLIVWVTYTEGDGFWLVQLFALLAAALSLINAVWTAIKTAKKVNKRVKKAKKQA